MAHWPQHGCMGHAISRRRTWTASACIFGMMTTKIYSVYSCSVQCCLYNAMCSEISSLKMGVKGEWKIENEYTLRQWKLVLQTTVAGASECQGLSLIWRSLCHAYQSWICFATCVVFSVVASFSPVSLDSEELFWSVMVDKNFSNQWYKACQKKTNKKLVLGLQCRNRGKVLW